MAKQAITIRVTGIKETAAGFKKVDSTLRLALVRETSHLARELQHLAEEHAAAQGFEPPGRSGRGKGGLIRGIHATASGYTVLLRETAVRTEGTNAPFPYPAVYEFGKRDHRPFLQPTAEAGDALAEKAALKALDEALGKF